MPKKPFVPYDDDEQVRDLGRRVLARSLPHEDWTHGAHCTLAVYLMTERPEIDPAREMPRIIRAYNEAVGTANTDSAGYHETITQFYVRAIRHFLDRLPSGLTLAETCNRLMASVFGERLFPLRFYSRDRLFSLAARRGWIEPDLASLDFSGLSTEPLTAAPARGG